MLAPAGLEPGSGRQSQTRSNHERGESASRTRAPDADDERGPGDEGKAAKEREDVPLPRVFSASPVAGVAAGLVAAEAETPEEAAQEEDSREAPRHERKQDAQRARGAMRHLILAMP